MQTRSESEVLQHCIYLKKNKYHQENEFNTLISNAANLAYKLTSWHTVVKQPAEHTHLHQG